MTWPSLLAWNYLVHQALFYNLILRYYLSTFKIPPILSTMRSICCLPVKSHSSRVPRKNFQPIKGTPLYIRTLDKLLSSSFDYVYVDSDSSEISEYCLKHSIPFVNRSENLASDNANGNHLILNSIKNFPSFDFYFQVFATAPFLELSTINSCLDLMLNSDHDSVFTVREKTTWYWSKTKPLNYDPCRLPRSQDVEKIFFETTGLYGISKKVAIERQCRIGYNPFLYEVSEIEAFDIDTKDDLEMARLLENALTAKNDC